LNFTHLFIIIIKKILLFIRNLREDSGKPNTQSSQETVKEDQGSDPGADQGAERGVFQRHAGDLEKV